MSIAAKANIPIVLRVEDKQKQAEIKGTKLAKLKTFVIRLELYMDENGMIGERTSQATDDYGQNEFEREWNKFK
jgi:hypothetical protein